MKITLEIELVTERCPKCGRYYAHEEGGHSCPRCRGNYYEDLETENDHLKRQIASLKGVIVRMKK